MRNAFAVKIDIGLGRDGNAVNGCGRHVSILIGLVQRPRKLQGLQQFEPGCRIKSDGNLPTGPNNNQTFDHAGIALRVGFVNGSIGHIGLGHFSRQSPSQTAAIVQFFVTNKHHSTINFFDRQAFFLEIEITMAFITDRQLSGHFQVRKVNGKRFQDASNWDFSVLRRQFKP